MHLKVGKQVQNNFDITALLLAAGYGTRLKPLTDNWPKCLMPIGERPLLEYWLQTLYQQQIKQVIVNTHYKSVEVERFLSSSKFDAWIDQVFEPELLGTAGTIRNNIKDLNLKTVLLVHADNWCQCNFSSFINYHKNSRPPNCPITMMTFSTDNPTECGITELNDEGIVIAFHEKVEKPPGNIANAAVYLLAPEVINWINDNPNVTDFSTEVLPHFVGRIATWHNNEIHKDIGTVESLNKAQKDPKPALIWPDSDKWQIAFRETDIYHTVNS